MQQGPGQLVAVQAQLFDQRAGDVERDSVEMVDQHSGRGQLEMRAWYGDVVVASGGSDARQIANLDTEVEFLVERNGEAVREVADADRTGPRRPAVQYLGKPQGDVEVAVDDRTDARTPHLDDDLLPGAEPGTMHLRDGSCGQRFGFQLSEHLAGRRTEFSGKQALDLVPCDGSGPILELAELGDEFVRQQITPGRQDLAQLDERAARVVQCQTQPPGQHGSPLPGRVAPSGQVGAEAVPYGNTSDL